MHSGEEVAVEVDCLKAQTEALGRTGHTDTMYNKCVRAHATCAIMSVLDSLCICCICFAEQVFICVCAQFWSFAHMLGAKRLFVWLRLQEVHSSSLA